MTRLSSTSSSRSLPRPPALQDCEESFEDTSNGASRRHFILPRPLPFDIACTARSHSLAYASAIEPELESPARAHRGHEPSRQAPQAPSKARLGSA